MLGTNRTRRLWLATLLASSLGALGCDDDAPELDAGPDTGDAGPGLDAGPGPTDAGMADAGPNEAPEGTITAPAAAVTISEGEAVSFASTCTDPNGDALTHAWDFGGGAPASTEAQPGAITFDTAGAYTVTYTCTDAQGLADPTPDTVMVAVNADTMASIDAPASDEVIAVGATVDFAGTCTDPEGATTITHLWDFDGAAPNATVEDPGTIQFDTAGMYVVTYRCFDTEGGEGVAMVTVTVSTPPEGVIDMPSTDSTVIAAGGTVDFQATCTDADGDAVTHAWDFGGGATDVMVEDPGPTTFATDGIYIVTYTCTDALGFDDPAPPSVTVIVGDPPQYVAITGDILVNDQDQLLLVDVSGASPGPVVDPIAGGWPADGDLSDEEAVLRSPDGRYLAFVADATTDSADDLYVVDLFSTSPNAVNLTNHAAGANVESILWSPDSQWIAFNADRDTAGAREMYVVDLSSGAAGASILRAHAPAVTNGDAGPSGWELPDINEDMAWSASSQKLYFIGDILTDGDTEAFVFDVTAPAAGATVLNPPVGTGDVDQIVSAGNDIAIFRGDLDSPGGEDVYAVDTSVATPTAVRLNPTPATSGEEVDFIRQRYVSPDGTRFVFNGDLDVASSDELWGVDLTATLTTGMAVKLNPAFTDSTQDINEPKWSPVAGDNRLLFAADEAFNLADELFLVNFTAATPSAATRIDAAYTADQDVGVGTWAPDGSGVAFTGDLLTPGQFEVFYIALPAGGTPGARVTVSQTFPPDADAFTTPFWASPTLVIYDADVDLDSQDALYVADVTTPGSGVRLHSASATTDTGADLSTSEIALVDGGPRVAFRGELDEEGVFEAYVADASAPGTSTLLHPSLAGTILDVAYIAGAF